MNPDKIKIMKTNPEITDLEIQEAMDFGYVLTQVETARRHKKKLTRWAMVSFLVVVTIGLSVYKQFYPAERSLPAIVPPVGSRIVQQDTLNRPSGPGQSTIPGKGLVQKPVVRKEKKKGQSTIVADSVKASYSPAEPLEGYPALYDYFNRELRYPEEAIKDSIQGVTSLSFVINTEGRVEHVNVEHSLGGAFDLEAVRLIEHMPPWKPAVLNGTPVSSKVSVPVTFQVKTIRRKK